MSARKAVVILALGPLLLQCGQPPTATTPFTSTDAFAGYTWTANATLTSSAFTATNPSGNQVQVAIPLPSATWSFSTGNNLAISAEPAVSFVYSAPAGSNTAMVTSSGAEGFSFSFTYPSAPTGWTYPTGSIVIAIAYDGTYVCSVKASNDIVLSRGEYAIELTR